MKKRKCHPKVCAIFLLEVRLSIIRGEIKLQLKMSMVIVLVQKRHKKFSIILVMKRID